MTSARDQQPAGERRPPAIGQPDLQAAHHRSVGVAVLRDRLQDDDHRRPDAGPQPPLPGGRAGTRSARPARRSGQPLAVLLLDIDHFKAINDVHGHLAGDDVLQELCRRLGRLLRGDELLARYGGEEFAVVLSDCSPEAARQVAERIRQSASVTPFETESAGLSLTLSIGLAISLGEHAVPELWPRRTRISTPPSVAAATASWAECRGREFIPCRSALVGRSRRMLESRVRAGPDFAWARLSPPPDNWAGVSRRPWCFSQGVY